MTDDLVKRLRDNTPLPVCPYDRRSPDYYTAPKDAPCVVCGSINEVGAPNLCTGADTRLFAEAADRIEALTAENKRLRNWSLKAYTVVEWVVGEGCLLPDPHFDADDTLLEGVAVLGVETSAEARAALGDKTDD